MNNFAKNINCPICKFGTKLVLNKITGYIEGSCYNIFECLNCKVSFSDPLESDYFVYESIYKNASKIPGYSRYFEYAEQVIKEENPLKYLAEKESIYWAIEEFLKDITQEEKGGLKILEIGSGLGYTTYALNRRGFSCLGVDISEEAVKESIQKFGEYYKNIDIFNKNFNEKFDIIIMTEVIEHVKNPNEFILRAKDLLRIGGKILITTPDKFFESEKTFWIGDLPPVHFFNFSETSLQKIGENLNLVTTFINFSEYNNNHNIYKRRIDNQNSRILYSQTYLNKDGTLKNKDFKNRLFYNIKKIFPNKIKILIKKVIYKNIYKYEGAKSSCLAVIYKKI